MLKAQLKILYIILNPFDNVRKIISVSHCMLAINYFSGIVKGFRIIYIILMILFAATQWNGNCHDRLLPLASCADSRQENDQRFVFRTFIICRQRDTVMAFHKRSLQQLVVAS